VLKRLKKSWMDWIKMAFKKGYFPWNKGLTIADPRVRKNVSSENSIACRFKKGYKSDKKGKSFEEYYGVEKAEKSIKKMSETRKRLIKEGKLKVWNKGVKGYHIHDDKFKEKVRKWATGRKHTKKSKRKISKTKLRKFASGEFDGVRKKISKGRIKYFEDNPEAREIIRKSRKKQVLPFNDSKIEVKIQDFLKQLKIEFFTHQYMKIEHGYQCDILIPAMNLIIECDGDFIHCNPAKYSPDFVRYPNSKGNQPACVIWERDRIRTKELIQKGFKVLRLWEFEIKKMSISEFKNRLKSPNFPPITAQ